MGLTDFRDITAEEFEVAEQAAHTLANILQEAQKNGAEFGFNNHPSGQVSIFNLHESPQKINIGSLVTNLRNVFTPAAVREKFDLRAPHINEDRIDIQIHRRTAALLHLDGA